MKTKIFLSILFTGLFIMILSARSPQTGPQLPEGWFAAGDMPGSYEMGVVEVQTPASLQLDKVIVHDKDLVVNSKVPNKVATIKSIDKKIDGFGTLMQNCKPGNYLNHRVRMSGYLKTENVKEWAGFWFRVDGKKQRDFLAFDNMKDGKKDRSITGTTDWTKYEIILDVPAGATNLAYGALLVGTGQIWFDNISFELVDNSVPTTGYTKNEKESTAPERTYYENPTNLNFEK